MADWSKRHRVIVTDGSRPSYVIEPGELDVFISDWVGWWIAIQPSWRQADVWPLPSSTTTARSGEDWGPLVRGGCNGFYVVILALAFWSEAGASDPRLTDAIADVRWVLKCVLEGLTRGEKRAAEPSSASRVKRFVFDCPVCLSAISDETLTGRGR